MYFINITILITLISNLFRLNDINNLRIENLTNLNDINEIYHYDTCKYVLDKSGFYISVHGDIFQKNRLAYDDEKGIWSIHYWLDSLMFYPSYPYKKPLKEFIDLKTYKSDSLGSFEKDKNYVYYYRPSSDGLMRFIVKKANPKTFQAIKDRWGKDNKNIFYETEIVKKADLNTFIVLSNQDSAMDKYHIFYQGKIVN